MKIKRLPVIITSIAVIGAFTGGVLTMDNQPAANLTEKPAAQVNANDQTPDQSSNNTSSNTPTPDEIKEHTTTIVAPTGHNITPTPVASTTTTIPTVTSYKQIPLDDQGNIDCEYTYSDGTTWQFHWKVVNPQGAWETDSFGNNGQWTPVTSTTGVCDDSIIGTPKS